MLQLQCSISKLRLQCKNQTAWKYGSTLVIFVGRVVYLVGSSSPFFSAHVFFLCVFVYDFSVSLPPFFYAFLFLSRLFSGLHVPLFILLFHFVLFTFFFCSPSFSYAVCISNIRQMSFSDGAFTFKPFKRLKCVTFRRIVRHFTMFAKGGSFT